MLKQTKLMTLLMASIAFPVLSSTYYVAANGDDANTGTSPSSPWKSLGRVSSAVLTAGDIVRFRRGDVFSGQLVIDESGSTAMPITITDYGSSGDKPWLVGNSGQQTVLIEDVNNITVNNLKISNDRNQTATGVNNKTAYGIYVSRTANATMENFQFANLTVDGVYPVDVGEANFDAIDSAGIYVHSIKNTDPASVHSIKNVTIEDSYFTNTQKLAIWLRSRGDLQINTPASRVQNVVIRNNIFEHTGGSGVVTSRAYMTLVENNAFLYTGSDRDSRNAARGSGAWFYNSQHIVARDNETRFARGPNDTAFIHVDMSNQYVIIERNIAQDNQGAFVEVLGDNQHVAIRYNIDYGSGWRSPRGYSIWMSDYHWNKVDDMRSQDIAVYNNSQIVSKRPSGEIIDTQIKLDVKDTTIANNIFEFRDNASMGIVGYETRYNSLNLRNNLLKGNIVNGFKNLNQQPINNAISPFAASDGSQDGFRLIENSAALQASTNIQEPPFPMAGIGIFANVTQKATSDLWGNPVDLSQPTHVGAYNGVPVASQDPVGPVFTVQGEDAVLSNGGAVRNCNAAQNGTMLAGVINGAQAQLGVTVANAGRYRMTVHYMAKFAMVANVDVNNAGPQNLPLPATGEWCFNGGTTGTQTFEVTLNSGSNSVTFSDINVLDAVDFEWLDDTAPIIPLDEEVEAETLTIAGNAFSFNCGPASSGQVVKNLINGSSNHVQWVIDAERSGNYQLTLDYYSAAASTANLNINNQSLGVTLPAGNGWCYQNAEPKSHSVTVPLNAGTNVIDVSNVGILDRLAILELTQ